MRTGSVEMRPEVAAGTDLAVAVVVALAFAVAAEGWTDGSSCSHPDLFEENVDGVQMVDHTALAAEEFAYEVRKADRTAGSYAEAEVEVHTEVVAGLVGEGIVRCSRN